MVNLTNASAFDSLNALQRLVRTSNTLPVRLSVAVHDNIEELQNQVQEIEEFRQGLLDDHAELDDDGEPLTRGDVEDDVDEENANEIKFQSDEDQEEYVDRLNEKYEEEVELDLVTVDVELVENVDAEPQIVFALNWMFEE